MNDFCVNLNINDCISGDECTNTLQKEITITSSSKSAILQGDYILNIIYVSSTYFTVIIQNGVHVIIRNIYPTYPMQISLPTKCCCHILTVSGTLG
ncbi:MAG: hypothetical protein RSE00_02195 [Clostridia bacterium]